MDGSFLTRGSRPATSLVDPARQEKLRPWTRALRARLLDRVAQVAVSKARLPARFIPCLRTCVPPRLRSSFLTHKTSSEVAGVVL